jgi:hypothetical protein
MWDYQLVLLREKTFSHKSWKLSNSYPIITQLRPRAYCFRLIITHTVSNPLRSDFQFQYPALTWSPVHRIPTAGETTITYGVCKSQATQWWHGASFSRYAVRLIEGVILRSKPSHRRLAARQIGSSSDRTNHPFF